MASPMKARVATVPIVAMNGIIILQVSEFEVVAVKKFI